MLKLKTLVIQLIFFGVLLGASQVSFGQVAGVDGCYNTCNIRVYPPSDTCIGIVAPAGYVFHPPKIPPGATGGIYFGLVCPVKSSASSSASSVPPPPPECAPHLSKNAEGFCVCANEGTQVNTGNQCDSTCPAGHDTSGMCYPEDCPWGEGTPAQCNDRTCSNEGHSSVEMLPGMWMCVKELPDDGSSSSTGGGDDNNNGGGDGNGNGGGQSSSAAPITCSNNSYWNGSQCVQKPQCPAGTGWGHVGGFWDCWSGWPDDTNGDCPEGQQWASYNGIVGCYKKTGDCPPGQNYGVVDGVLSCHGRPIQSCPNGMWWGQAGMGNGGEWACFGAPSCPAGYTHGVVDGVAKCWLNTGCDSVGNCASSRASSSAPNCPNGQVWNGAQCQLPLSSSAGSSGSGNGEGDGDGDGTNSSAGSGSGNGGGAGSSAGSGSSTGAGIGEGSCSPEGQTAPNCTGDHDPITCAIAINTWQVECNSKLWRDDLVGDAEFNTRDTLLDGENPKNKIATVESSAFYEGADFNTQRFGGNASSCPADRSVSVLGGTIRFTYSWICAFASLIRNIVLAIAYFVAALIYIRGFMGVTE